MKTYLVTGVAGFVGSRLAAMILERGDAVVGIDSLEDGEGAILREHRLQDLLPWPRFRFHRMNILDFQALDDLMARERFQAVFHLAAKAGVRQSLVDPWTYLRVNADGTLNVLEAMRRNGGIRMILASTSSLYAGLPLPFSEDAAVNTPISPYAASKKAAEAMAYTYHHQYGISVAILRYFTVFGPSGRPDMAPFRFIESVRQGLPVVVHGDGGQTRDFTFVDDICRGTLQAEALGGYQIVNLGGGKEPVSIRQFLEWIEELVGRRAIVRHEPSHEADMRETMADIRKARELMDWSPRVDVRQGLVATVGWHLRRLPAWRIAS